MKAGWAEQQHLAEVPNVDKFNILLTAICHIHISVNFSYRHKNIDLGHIHE